MSKIRSDNWSQGAKESGRRNQWTLVRAKGDKVGSDVWMEFDGLLY